MQTASQKHLLSKMIWDLFELVMALEEEYGVEIPSEDLEKILTVQDVIDYMKNKGVEA